ncbi:hypothetical protein MNBD_GAMMA09-2308 [hydrothermal vent metagenome]|uniref:HTH cro/C1-type domain-containing protein n=1 Tax=hydrothermal vent metagenome TaxID=652676 RepID=A0A3B0XYJ2_9ZZZZ
MNNEINDLIKQIISTGKEQGLSKGDITSRSGMPGNKFGRIINTDPRASTLIRLGHSVGLRLVFVEDNEDLSAINNREVF